MQEQNQTGKVPRQKEILRYFEYAKKRANGALYFVHTSLEGQHKRPQSGHWYFWESLMDQPKQKRQRTLLQNKALHKYFTQLSESLNDAGLDMRHVLNQNIDIPWTPENVKNHLWRPVQIGYLEKESTAELSTDEICKIYEFLNRHLSVCLGVSVSWPSLDDERINSIVRKSQHE